MQVTLSSLLKARLKGMHMDIPDTQFLVPYLKVYREPSQTLDIPCIPSIRANIPSSKLFLVPYLKVYREPSQTLDIPSIRANIPSSKLFLVPYLKVYREPSQTLDIPCIPSIRVNTQFKAVPSSLLKGIQGTKSNFGYPLYTQHQGQYPVQSCS